VLRREFWILLQGTMLQSSGEVSMELQTFFDRFNLNADAQGILANLSPEIQTKVISDFRPRDETRDCSNLVMKFAMSLSGKGKGKGGGGFAAQHVAPFVKPSVTVPASAPAGMMEEDPEDSIPVPTEDIEAYVMQWALGEEAQSAFLSLPPSKQRKVMNEFNPRDTSSDVNRIFVKFVSGISMRAGKGGGMRLGIQQPQMPATAQMNASAEVFILQWSLNEEAAAFFRQQAPDIQQKIVTEFAPRDTSSDVSNLFFKFAQGIISKSRASPGGFAGAPAATAQFRPSNPAASEQEKFCVKWNFTPEAVFKLLSLPAETQERVIRDFNPRQTTSDVTNLFMKFADGVNGKSAGKGRPSPYGF